MNINHVFSRWRSGSTGPRKLTYDTRPTLGACVEGVVWGRDYTVLGCIDCYYHCRFRPTCKTMCVPCPSCTRTVLLLQYHTGVSILCMYKIGAAACIVLQVAVRPKAAVLTCMWVAACSQVVMYPVYTRSLQSPQSIGTLMLFIFRCTNISHIGSLCK